MTATRVRQVKERSWGSGTHLADQVSIPGLVYYPSRTLACVVRHSLLAGLPCLGLLVWARTGSWVTGLLAAAVVFGGGLTVWVRWGQPHGEAAGLSHAEAVQALRTAYRLRKRWPLACDAGGLTGRGRNAHPWLRWPMQPLPGGGFRARLAPARVGRTVTDVQRGASTIAEIIGCRDVIVTGTGPGTCLVEFHWADPVGRHLPLTALPVAPDGKVAYGIRADGSPATIRYGISVLIGGLTSFGKSTAVHAMVADANRQKLPLRLYVSDPKGGIELAEYGRHVGEQNGTLHVRAYSKTVKDTLTMIDTAEEGMRRRQRDMETRGVRKWEPSAAEPLCVLILDESLLLADTLKKGHDSALARIAFTGRACGYVIWAIAQVGHADVLGRLRDMVPQRICFATPTPQVTDTFLGQGAAALGADCDGITQPGVGFSFSDSDRRPMKFRAAMVTDQQLTAVAAGRYPRGMPMRTGQEEALYRHFDADGQLLYVGKSNDPLRRTREHLSSPDEDWTRDIAFTKTEWHKDRAAVLAAEKKAIGEERPVHNQQHNTGNPLRRVRDGARGRVASYRHARAEARLRPDPDPDSPVRTISLMDDDTGPLPIPDLPPEADDEPAIKNWTA